MPRVNKHTGNRTFVNNRPDAEFERPWWLDHAFLEPTLALLQAVRESYDSRELFGEPFFEKWIPQIYGLYGEQGITALSSRMLKIYQTDREQFDLNQEIQSLVEVGFCWLRDGSLYDLGGHAKSAKFSQAVRDFVKGAGMHTFAISALCACKRIQKTNGSYGCDNGTFTKETEELLSATTALTMMVLERGLFVRLSGVLAIGVRPARMMLSSSTISGMRVRLKGLFWEIWPTLWGWALVYYLLCLGNVVWGRSHDRHLVFALINVLCWLQAMGLLSAPSVTGLAWATFLSIINAPLIQGWMYAVLPYLEEDPILGVAHDEYVRETTLGFLEGRSFPPASCKYSRGLMTVMQRACSRCHAVRESGHCWGIDQKTSSYVCNPCYNRPDRTPLDELRRCARLSRGEGERGDCCDCEQLYTPVVEGVRNGQWYFVREAASQICMSCYQSRYPKALARSQGATARIRTPADALETEAYIKFHKLLKDKEHTFHCNFERNGNHTFYCSFERDGVPCTATLCNPSGRHFWRRAPGTLSLTCRNCHMWEERRMDKCKDNA
ncbi:hypothetical protein WJX73_002161 [Symbiochloris irregularis]|uniref:Uncharacterized protein n=1 Tax=Symbiochloris irregularis TaxID=706552 RepID=A0AAW1PS73_9CHLO